MERLLVLLIISLNILTGVNGQNWTSIIPSGYNPLVPPNATGVTNVNITAIVNSLVAVSESAQSFQLDLTFNLKWIDNRLNMSSLITESQNTTHQMNDILLGGSYVTNFWTPDIYFQNALSVSVVNSIVAVQYMAIGVNNNITYTRRLSGTFICKMDLTTYPQDYQYCSLEAVSLTKSKSQLYLFWEDFTTAVTDTSKFRIRSTFMDTCFRSSYTAEFSCQMATLKLVRRLSYYIIRYYAPTFLCVVITFVSFWIPPIGFPARVTIVVTPLLSLITTSISVENEINVEYVVTIYWWIIFCEIFVFLALIEYAVAISWAHFTNEKKASKQMVQNGNNFSFVSGHYFGNNGLFHAIGRAVDKFLHFFFGNVDYTKDPMMRNKVDYFSRILFPFLWIIYTFIFVLGATIPWSLNYN